MPQRKGMHMSAEDMNKDHLDETRVIETQAEDAQARDAHADKTTYVNVAYQKEDGTYEGAWLPADEVVSHEAAAKPAEGRITSLGMGGKRFSAATAIPTPGAPRAPTSVTTAWTIGSRRLLMPVASRC